MIELPYPTKSLWPNGRSHWAAKAKATKDHRTWAHAATLAWRGRDYRPIEGPVDVLLTFYGKPKGPLPDKDNALASAKAYLDGIADALGVNDRTFTPRVQFAGRSQFGKVVVTLA